MVWIDPLDTLFFRDGRPFTMGEDGWGAGLFPPPPGVLYGALRSAWFAGHQDQFPKAGRKDDPTARLRIKAFFLRIGEKVDAMRECFPLPLDCVRPKNAGRLDRNRYYPLKSVKEASVSGCALSRVLTSDAEVETEAEVFLGRLMLESYLSGEDGPWGAISLADHIIPEPKTGIGREDATRKADDGMLYRAGMLRLKNLDMVAEYDGLELPGEGLLKLGGEAKAARYATLGGSLPVPGAPALSGDLFKVYLATPALFAGGWLPGWLDAATMTGTYGNLRLQLVAAAVGKPQAVGGFDMAAGRPKPMRRAVPAGSVYYFRLRKGSMEEVKAAFHNRRVSDYRSEEGYGWCLLGKVKECW